MTARKPSRSAQPAAADPAQGTLSVGLLAGVVSGAVASVLDGEAGARHAPAIDRHTPRIEPAAADQPPIAPPPAMAPQAPVTQARQDEPATDTIAAPPPNADAPAATWPRIEWSDIADHHMPSDHEIMPPRMTAVPDAIKLGDPGGDAAVVAAPTSPTIMSADGTWQLPDELLAELHDLPAMMTMMTTTVAELVAPPVASRPALPDIAASIEQSVASAVGTAGELVAAVPTAIAAPIPMTILGAESTWQAPDGLLAELFDGPALDAPAMVAAPAVALPAPSEPVASVEQSIAGLAADAPVTAFEAAVEVVHIGFAGQSYADTVDAHAGPFGPHTNLLQGIA